VWDTFAYLQTRDGNTRPNAYAVSRVQIPATGAPGSGLLKPQSLGESLWELLKIRIPRSQRERFPFRMSLMEPGVCVLTNSTGTSGARGGVAWGLTREMWGPGRYRAVLPADTSPRLAPRPPPVMADVTCAITFGWPRRGCVHHKP